MVNYYRAILSPDVRFVVIATFSNTVKVMLAVLALVDLLIVLKLLEIVKTKKGGTYQNLERAMELREDGHQVNLSIVNLVNFQNTVNQVVFSTKDHIFTCSKDGSWKKWDINGKPSWAAMH